MPGRITPEGAVGLQAPEQVDVDCEWPLEKSDTAPRTTIRRQSAYSVVELAASPISMGPTQTRTQQQKKEIDARCRPFQTQSTPLQRQQISRWELESISCRLVNKLSAV